MTLTIKAKLLRRNGVFLAGETVECEIVVEKLPSNSPTSEDIVAWASCQIVCLQTLTAQKCQLPVESDLTESHAALARRTSLSDQLSDTETNILSLRLAILFCDLKIQSGETKSFLYKEVLPGDGIPPSFKGSAVRYQYKLVLSAQKLGSEIRTVRLPLRLLVLPGLSKTLTIDCSEPLSNGLTNGDESTSESGDEQKLSDKQSLKDVAEAMIESITSAKGISVFNVILDEKKVAKFRMAKMAFKLGDEIIGHFDFSDTDVKCVEYCVTLQSEEEIDERLRIKSRPFKWTNSQTKSFFFCYSYLSSEVLLTIPLWATHTFHTEIMKFHWRLHFEFVINSSPIQTELIAHNNGDRCWVAPKEIEIKTLVWDLPIKILPSSPTSAGLTLGKVEENHQIHL